MRVLTKSVHMWQYFNVSNSAKNTHFHLQAVRCTLECSDALCPLCFVRTIERPGVFGALIKDGINSSTCLLLGGAAGVCLHAKAGSAFQANGVLAAEVEITAGKLVAHAAVATKICGTHLGTRMVLAVVPVELACLAVIVRVYELVHEHVLRVGSAKKVVVAYNDLRAEHTVRSLKCNTIGRENCCLKDL
jgi:hypothetical protein